nr:MAG TPA: hypothetical protein [Caudoviricetes sp.]
MIEQIKQKINGLSKNNFERYYNHYDKRGALNAFLTDINNILDSYLTPETTFILDEETFDAFSLIYALCDKGIVNLEHDDFETEGVKVTY